MSKILFTALAFSALIAGASVARADDMAGQTPAYGAASESGSVQLSDPTNTDSIRSHGNT